MNDDEEDISLDEETPDPESKASAAIALANNMRQEESALTGAAANTRSLSQAMQGGPAFAPGNGGLGGDPFLRQWESGITAGGQHAAQSRMLPNGDREVFDPGSGQWIRAGGVGTPMPANVPPPPPQPVMRPPTPEDWQKAYTRDGRFYPDQMSQELERRNKAAAVMAQYDYNQKVRQLVDQGKTYDEAVKELGPFPSLVGTGRAATTTKVPPHYMAPGIGIFERDPVSGNWTKKAELPKQTTQRDMVLEESIKGARKELADLEKEARKATTPEQISDLASSMALKRDKLNKLMMEYQNARGPATPGTNSVSRVEPPSRPDTASTPQKKLMRAKALREIHPDWSKQQILDQVEKES